MAPKATASRGGVLDARVTVVGLVETQKILKQLEPKVHRTLNRRLRKIALEVAADAASNASVASRTGRMAGGYKVKRGKVRSASAQGFAVINDTPEGAILEFAGAASSGSTPQGQALIRSLEAKYGPPGRFAWEAFDAKEEQHIAALMAIVAEMEAETQKAFNTVGGFKGGVSL